MDHLVGADQTEVGDATVLPETPAATAFFHTARNAVTHRQASSLLKIDADRFNELIAADIVRPIFSSIGDPTQNAYNQTELDALLHRLIAGRRIGLAEGDDHITYAVLARVAEQARCTFPDVVNLLLADPTVETYCKPNDIGLRALYVSIEAVRTAIHGPRLHGLTPWRFVKTLNITRHDFVALRDMGLIRIERVPHPALNAPFAIVPRASVNDFRRRFIALQAVADRMGRHWLTARRRLNVHGIEPVYEGTTPWSWFYERTPVLECLFGGRPYKAR